MSIKKGYTLSEVLITIAIIGIIAALITPGLLVHTKRRSWTTQLKNAHMILNAAVEKLKYENSYSMVGLVSSQENIESLLCQKLTCIKTGGDFHDFYLLGQSKSSSAENSIIGSATLINGMILGFYTGSTDTATCSRESYVESSTNKGCGEFVIDINGENSPNCAGRDIFKFVIARDGLYPMGYKNTSGTSCDEVSNSWEGCAGKILIEGEMNY